MIIPIRCMSCGKPVGHLWETYQRESKKRSPQKVLDELGLSRFCCRSLFLTHIDLIPRVARYSK